MIKGDEKGKGSLHTPTDLFNNEQVKIKKNIELDIWDLGGKLPHLWVHHFKGSQGIIYMIDGVVTLNNDQKKQSAIQELLNVIVGNSNIPIVVFINNKSKNFQENNKQEERCVDNQWLIDNVFDKLDNFGKSVLQFITNILIDKYMIKVVAGNLMMEKGLDQLGKSSEDKDNIIYQCVNYLIENMKAL